MFKKIIDGAIKSRVLHTRNKELDFITPNYIPSFSSRDDYYLKSRITGLLSVIPQQTVLISAYDYYMLNVDGHVTSDFIHKSFKNKLLFLDSGGYELQFSNKDCWDAYKYM
ncbi:MAG: hypothetical protein RG740_07775, partial [Acholeplasmataceae bacterium]|nr:hypothetical protein [Acholeplasmataceae bacterium]